MKLQSLHVTVVIPAYNEEARIAQTLFEVKDYLSQQAYSSDIVIIDDGSHDLTAEVARVVDIYGAEIKDQRAGAIVKNVENAGKGYSIAKGLLVAQGDIIVFTDADLSTPISELHKLIKMIASGYDLVIGSRNLPDSQIENRPVIRSFMSRAFNLCVKALGLTVVSDSQCGFKAYRQDAARNIAKKQKTFGFCFDVEHIHTAEKLGYKVAEVPVIWRHDEGSTLSLLSDSLKMAIDLVKIRWVHRNL